MAANIEIRTDESLAALVTLARAGHLTGDTAFERAAQQRLQDQYGLRLVFDQQVTQVRNRKEPSRG